MENDPGKDNNKCTFHRNVLYIAEMNGFWSIFFTDAETWGAVSRSSDRICDHGLFWNISPRSILSIPHVFKRFDTPNFSARFWKKKVLYFSKFDRRGHSYFNTVAVQKVWLLADGCPLPWESSVTWHCNNWEGVLPHYRINQQPFYQNLGNNWIRSPWRYINASYDHFRRLG